MKLGQWLISAGCIILFGTAIYHEAGYTSMARAICASDAKPALVAEMKTLWLIFSLQLIILSVLAFSASRCASARQLILLCSSPLFVCAFGPESTFCPVEHKEMGTKSLAQADGKIEIY